MRQNASLRLETLDPDTRKAAQDAAERAGLTLEAWIASAVSEQAGKMLARAAEPARRRPAPEPSELEAVAAKLERTAAESAAAEGRRRLKAAYEAALDRRTRDTETKTAKALDSVASWIERAEDRLSETARATTETQERTATILNDALSLMTRRLDEIDRKVAQGDTPSMIEALKAIERIEQRLQQVAEDKRSQTQNAQIEQALHAFEERIAGLTERVAEAAARPVGRRIAAAPGEIKSAITEIRARQKELAPSADRDQAGPRSHSDILMSMRADIAKLAGRMGGGASGEGSVEDLRDEIERVQASVQRIPTRDEVMNLEQLLRALMGRLSELAAGASIATIMAPIGALQEEVRRLGEAVEGDVHVQLAGDVETLIRKLDAAAGSGADPNLVEALWREIAYIRGMLGSVAHPQQVDNLTQEMAELNRRFAETAARQVDAGEFDTLKTAVEDIRTSLQSGRGRKGAAIAPAGLDGVIERLDRLDENLRGSTVKNELKPIEEMLRSLAEKLDHAERPDADRDALDSLERQISAIGARLERGNPGDALLGSLERSMGDLMAQVEGLRTAAFDAAERAAKSVVVNTLSAIQNAPAEKRDPGPLEHDMAELKAFHSAADKRTQDTLGAVHTTLEKVAARLAGLEKDFLASRDARPQVRPPAPGPTPAPIAASQPAEEVESSIKQALAATPSEPSKVSVPTEADRPLPPGDEVLLEPGAARPRIKPAASGEGDSSDIKASFIAAARRAAQTAAAEAAAASKTKISARRPDAMAPAEDASQAAGLVARLRGGIDKHRRPILIGLAAIVLALASIQLIGSFGSSETPAPRSAAPITSEPGRVATPDTPEPPTTQSLAPDAPSGGAIQPQAPIATAPPVAPPDVNIDGAKIETRGAVAPGASTAPALGRIPAASIGDIPAAVGPRGLRQAALAGDPIAVHEIAARAADGRGMPRDPKLAARLFEKAAAQGLAPAQYRTGNLYEKGIGVPRDVAAAKLWYQRAAEGGNTRAMHNLAVLLAEGAGGRPDYAGALEWFRRAAEHGVRDSQFNLGVLLARGLGTQQDLAKAYTWFAIGAGQGDEDAGKKRDEIGARLPPADVTAAKLVAEKWRAETADKLANEVQPPVTGWTEAPAPNPPAKKAGTPTTKSL